MTLQKFDFNGFLTAKAHRFLRWSSTVLREVRLLWAHLHPYTMQTGAIHDPLAQHPLRVRTSIPIRYCQAFPSLPGVARHRPRRSQRQHGRALTELARHGIAERLRRAILDG